MNTLWKQLQSSPRRGWACVGITLVAVVTVTVWAAHMEGDSGQIAAMLGATIAVIAATTTGRRSCRPAFLTRGPRSSTR